MKKYLTAITAAVLSLSLLNPLTAAAEENNKDFDAFLDEQFEETMEADYLTLHYTIRDYKSFGIEKPVPEEIPVDLEYYEDSVEETRSVLDELHGFDYESLSERQKVDYKVLEFVLENSLMTDTHPLYEDWFGPANGVWDVLNTNLTEYVFAEREDFDDYLAYTASLSKFYDSVLELTKWQAGQGVFMTDAALEESLSLMRQFTSEKENNPLIVIFNEKADRSTLLSDAEKADYKERFRKIVLESYVPAVDKCADEVEKLKGSRSVSGGLYEYGKEAQEYYYGIVRSKTSCRQSVEDIFEELTAAIDSAIGEYMNILMNNRSAQSELDNADPGLDGPDEVLSFLQDHLDDYPEGPKVTYEYSYLEKALENDTTVAYYMEPPIDDPEHNVIRINGRMIGDSMNLYSTLAHEGFPGHLYQITWYIDQKPSRIRNAVSMLGYTEGWAEYSANMAVYNAPHISDDVKNMIVADDILNYGMVCAADLAVNGMGWDTDDVANWMDQRGFDGKYAGEIVEEVLMYPGLFLPYGVGTIKMLNLRSETEEILGKDFKARDYNTVVLTDGPRMFELVEEDIDQYISEVTGKNKDEVKEAHGSVIHSITPSSHQSKAKFLQTKAGVLTLTGVFVLVAVLGLILLRLKKKNDPLDR